MILFLSILFFVFGLIARFHNWKKEMYLKKIVQVQVVDRTHELNELAKYLDRITQRLIREKDIFEQDVFLKKLEVISINEENKKLLEENKRTLKSNKHQLFYVEESTLSVYNHYKRVTDILNTVIKSEVDYEDVFSTLNTANHNLLFVGNYFKDRFGMSPEEYVEQKVSLTGTKQNGDTYVSGFSKN